MPVIDIQTATAFERLQAAFEQMRGEGIDSRGPSKCCGSCSAAAVPDGVPYTFWNQQSHESAFVIDEGALVDGDLVGDLYLSYGPGTQGDGEAFNERCRLHGERVAGALRAHGLTVRWNGDPGETIVVEAERQPTGDERHLLNGEVQCSVCCSWSGSDEMDGDGRCGYCQVETCVVCGEEVESEDAADAQGRCATCSAEDEDEDDEDDNDA